MDLGLHRDRRLASARPRPYHGAGAESGARDPPLRGAAGSSARARLHGPDGAGLPCVSSCARQARASAAGASRCRSGAGPGLRGGRLARAGAHRSQRRTRARARGRAQRTRTSPGVAAALRAPRRRAGALSPTIGVLAATAPERRRARRRPARRPARGLRRARPRAAGGAARPARHRPGPPASRLKYTWAYDAVRAAEALAAAGGGSRRTVAVIDTGLDVNHPEFAGRIARHLRHRHRGRRRDRHGRPRHLRLRADLCARRQRRRRQGRGREHQARGVDAAASATTAASLPRRDLLRGIEFAIRSGADVINMSLAGRGLHAQSRRARSRRPSSTTCSRSPRRATTPRRTATRSSSRPRPSAARAAGAASACRWPPPRPSGAHAALLDPQRLREPGRARARATLLRVRRVLDPPGQQRHRVGRARLPARAILLARAAPASPTARARASPRRSSPGSPRSPGRSSAARLRAGGRGAHRAARQTMGSGWNEFTGAGVVDGRPPRRSHAPTT